MFIVFWITTTVFSIIAFQADKREIKELKEMCGDSSVVSVSKDIKK